VEFADPATPALGAGVRARTGSRVCAGDGGGTVCNATPAPPAQSTCAATA
jgi:hypothetical protein